LLWLLVCCGGWAAVAAELLWRLIFCGCWAAVAAELLWRLGCCGCWASVAAGLLWRLGCCGGWAAVYFLYSAYHGIILLCEDLNFTCFTLLLIRELVPG
jgi:hypothetical protein